MTSALSWAQSSSDMKLRLLLPAGACTGSSWQVLVLHGRGYAARSPDVWHGHVVDGRIRHMCVSACDSVCC
jgi:hypothetical protein